MKAKFKTVTAVVLIALGAAAYVLGFGQYQWMAGTVQVNLYPAAALILAGIVLLWRTTLTFARS